MVVAISNLRDRRAVPLRLIAVGLSLILGTQYTRRTHIKITNNSFFPFLVFCSVLQIKLAYVSF